MSAGNKISSYSSARELVPSCEITVEKFVGTIRGESCAELIKIVRHSPTEEAKGKAKRQLPAVQLSGRVTSGKRAQAIQEGRFAHSGFLQLDASTKDPARLCFFSSDAGCTWNPDPQVFPVPELPAEVSRPTANPAAPTRKPRGTSKAFPEPPEEGIHNWLPKAARFCRTHERLGQI